MAEVQSKLIVRMVDLLTAPAKKAAASLRRLGAADTAGRAALGTARLTDAIERNNRALDRSRMRLVDAAAGYYALTRAFGAPIRAAMSFESAMADVRKVVDFETPASFRQFSRDLRGLSTVIPVTAEGLAQITAAAGQAGIPRAELIDWTELAAKVGVAFDMSADQVGDDLAKIRTALGLNTEQTGLLADAINHLSNNMASKAPDLINFERRVGALAAQYGFSATEAAAFGSAMIASGAEAEVASTTFRNMGRALTRGASATGRQRDAFRTLGLDARKVAEAMQRDAVGTTIRVIERLNELPEAMRAATMSDLFGDEARAIGPLITNLDMLRDAVALVADEQQFAGSAAREYAVRAETAEHRTQRFWNRVNNLAIALGNALIPGMERLIDVIEPVIAKVTTLAETYPNLTAGIAAVAAGLVAFRIAVAAGSFVWFNLKSAVLGVVKGFRLLRGAVLIVSRLFMANPIIAAVTAIAGAAYLIYRNWDDVVAFFKRLWADIKTLFRLGVEAVTALLEKLGLLGPIKQAWEGLSRFFDRMWEGIKATFQGAWEFIKPIIDAISFGADRVGAAARHAAPPGAGSVTRGSHPLMRRADGGDVTRGRSYLVGEEGPEIFRPGKSGQIIPNSALGWLNLSPSFNFTIYGDADPEQIEATVRRALREETRELVRGVYADTGAAF